jgi:uncharacterized protein (DUF169 family)
VGVIDEDDGSTGLPFRVTGGAWPRGYRSENAWWFAPEALERVEAAAIYERLKEMALRLDIKIVLYKPAPLPLDLDLALESGVLLSRSGTGPLTWTVAKNRPPKETS